jgi:hypothetical protein
MQYHVFVRFVSKITHYSEKFNLEASGQAKYVLFWSSIIERRSCLQIHILSTYCRIQAHDLYSFVPFLDHIRSSDVLNKTEASFLLHVPSPLHENSHKYIFYFVHLQPIHPFLLPEVLHILYTWRFLTLLTGSRLCASWRPMHHSLWDAHEFGDESICLLADNVRNEVVTIHRSQEVSKMLSFYT